MPSTYHIVQYAPNPMVGERVNVGIIVLSDQEKLIYFVENHQRLRCLAGKDAVRVVRSFARTLPNYLTPEFVADAVKEWRGCIQITKARGSLHEGDALLSDLVTRLLVDPPVAEPGHLLKSDVQESVRQSLTRNLKSRFGGVWKFYLKEDYRIDSGNDRYMFDFAIVNGSPRHLIQSLSFQVDAVKRIETQINAAAWSIQKLRVTSKIPVTVVAAKPQPNQADAVSLFEQARRTYGDLDTEMITHEDVEPWAVSVVSKFPDMRHT